VPQASVPVSDSIQGVHIARIDRLQEAAKPLLQHQERLAQLRLPPMQAWMLALLSDVHRLYGHLAQAHDLGHQGSP